MDQGSYSHVINLNHGCFVRIKESCFVSDADHMLESWMLLVSTDGNWVARLCNQSTCSTYITIPALSITTSCTNSSTMEVFSRGRWTSGSAPLVKQIWNVAMHVMHTNFWYVVNTTAFYLGRYCCSSLFTKEFPGFIVTTYEQYWPHQALNFGNLIVERVVPNY